MPNNKEFTQEQIRIAAKIITHNGTNNRWGNTWRIHYYLNLPYEQAKALETLIYNGIMNNVASTPSSAL